MAQVNEIAPDVYRISIYVPEIDLQFNHFLVKDDEPLLYHTGFRGMFPELREAVAGIIDLNRLRWISFSHFESDECGALNHWLEAAPAAQAVCSYIGALVSVNDFANRPPRPMQDGEILATGRRRYRFCSTAHLPHGWDAGVLFEETSRTLFCSDLFLNTGRAKPLTEQDIVEPAKQALVAFQNSALGYSVPYTPQTGGIFERLAALRPETLATMHGSSFRGDGSAAISRLADVIRETMAGEPVR